MVNLKNIKRPVIVHYARTPIGSNPSQVLGLYVFDNDKMNSFVPETLNEEFLAIYDFKRMVEQLISEGGTIISWCQTTTEFGATKLDSKKIEPFFQAFIDNSGAGKLKSSADAQLIFTGFKNRQPKCKR